MQQQANTCQYPLLYDLQIRKKIPGRIAVITGAGRGIGAATAHLFAQQGARVVVNDLDLKVAEEVVADINSKGGTSMAVAGSVTDELFPVSLLCRLMSSLLSRIYIGPIDGPDCGRIWSFGYSCQQCRYNQNNPAENYIQLHLPGFLWDGMLHKMSDAQWQAIVDCHGTAPFRMIRAAAPYMRDAAKKELDAGIPIQDRVTCVKLPPSCVCNVCGEINADSTN